MDSFLGQILSVAFSFAPRNTAVTNGQILPINQNQALFALLGTTYGGDGRSTFGLPDTQARTIIGYTGMRIPSAPPIGTSAGEASHALTIAEMPPHQHGLNATTQGTAVVQPDGHLPGPAIAGAPAYGASSSTTSLRTPTISATGAGQPHSNMQPSLPIMFAIVIAGIYPSRQ